MKEPIHPKQIEAFKRMTVEQKLQAIGDMWQLARELLATGIRRRNPDWGEAQVWEEVRQRMIHGTS